MRTRREIAEAARRLFAARGWGETTVRDIARAAGVSEPTVYTTYGGRTGLAIALVDAIDLEAGAARLLTELEAAIGDPPAQLAALVAFDRRLFERGGDVIRLLREGGRTEPRLAAAYRAGRARGEEVRRATFTSWSDVDTQYACDVYAALCDAHGYSTLVAERGWSPERVERWWYQILCSLLIA